jgi:hypothetical protein
VGGWPPTLGRAGDDARDTSGTPPRILNGSESVRADVFSFVSALAMNGSSEFGGGGSVRRRNALHEVGGRS